MGQYSEEATDPGRSGVGGKMFACSPEENISIYIQTTGIQGTSKTCYCKKRNLKPREGT